MTKRKSLGRWTATNPWLGKLGPRRCRWPRGVGHFAPTSRTTARPSPDELCSLERSMPANREAGSYRLAFAKRRVLLTTNDGTPRQLAAGILLQVDSRNVGSAVATRQQNALRHDCCSG
jgi:hypothetical protein